MAKSKFLKNLLTTASAVAVLVGSVQGAEAAGAARRQNINNGPTVLDNGGGTVNVEDTAAPGGGGVNFVNSNNFNFKAGSTAATTLTTAGNVDISVIDLNNTSPGDFTVAHDVTLGSVVDVAGVNTKHLNVVVNDGKSLTLNGVGGKDAGNALVAPNTYTSLGDVTIGSGAAGDATLKVTTAGAVSIASNIDGNGDDKGVLVINSGANKATFTGAIGVTHKLNEIAVGDAVAAGDAQFDDVVKATTIKLGDGNAGTAVFNGEVTATDINVGLGNNGTATFNDAVTATTMTVGQNAGGDGTVTFNDAESAITNVNFDTAGSVVNVGNGNATKVTGNFDFLDKDANIKIKGGVAGGGPTYAVIEGNIDSTTAAASNGTLKIEGWAQVTGTIGSTHELKVLSVGDAAEGKGEFIGAVKATTINVGNAGGAGTATFIDIVKSDAINVGSAANNGTVTFNAAVTNVAGNGAAAITVGTAGNAQGVVKFNAGNSKAAVTFAGNNAGTSVTIGNAGAAKVTGDFTGSNAANKIILNGGAVGGGAALAHIQGDIISNGADNIALSIKGQGKVEGTVGNVARIGSIKVGDGAAAEAEFTGVVKATDIFVGVAGDAGTATFSGAVGATGTITVGGSIVGGDGTATFGAGISNNAAGGGATTLNIGQTGGGNGTVTMTGAGASTSAVNLKTDGSSLTYNATGDLTGNVSFVGSDATVTIQNTGKIIGNFTTTANNKGKIIFDNGANAAEIRGTIGAAGNALNTITLQGGNGAVTLGNGAVLVKKLMVNNTDAAGGGTLAGALTVGTGAGEGVVFGTDAGKLKIAAAGMTGNVDFVGFDGTLEITAGGAGSIAGNIDNSVAGAAKGTIKFLGAGGITGQVGATTAVKIIDADGAGAVALNNANGVKVDRLRIGNAGTTVAVTGPLTVATTLNNGVVFAAAGTLNLAGANAIVGNVDFVNNNGIINVTNANAVVNGRIKSTGGANGTIHFKGAAATIQGGIGDAVNTGAALVKFGDAAATSLGFGAANETYYATEFEFGNAGSKLLLNKENTTLVGNIKGIALGTEGIEVSENATILGEIGTTAGVGYIKLTAADKKLTVDSGAAAGSITTLNGANQGITFTANGILEIKGAGGQTISAPITTKTPSTGEIILNANIGAGNDVAFVTAIGDKAGNSLGKLTVGSGVSSNGGNAVEFQEASNIDLIHFQGASNLKLGKTGANTKIGEIQLDTNNSVNLIINQNVELIGKAGGAEVNFGTKEGNKLKELQFVGNKTLTIGDGINIYAQTGVTNAAAAGNGALVFKGNSIFDAAMTNANAINTIDGPGAGKEAKVMKKVFANGAITVDAGTLTFADDVTANGGIDAKAAATTHRLKFINNANINVAGAVGAGQALAAIEFAGGQVTFANNVTHDNKKFVFSNTNKAVRTKVIFNANTNVGNVDVDSSAAAATPIIVTATTGNIDFTKTVTGNVEYNLTDPANAAVARINSANLTGASFTTGTASKNSVEFGLPAGATVKSIGTQGTNVANVTFVENGTVSEGTYSEEIIINDSKTGNFNGAVGTGTGAFRLGNAGGNSATAVFADGFTLDRAITTQAAGQGIVNFAGSATINQAITGLGFEAVNFQGAAGKEVALNNDITATNITFGASTVKLTDNNAVLTGTTTANATTFDLGGQTLRAAGTGLVLAGDVVINTIVAEKGKSAGNIKIDAGATNSLAGVASLTVNIDDDTNNVDAFVEGGTTFTVIDNRGTLAGALLSTDKIDVASSNIFNKWTPQVSSKNSISFTSTDNTQGVIDKVIPAAASSDDRTNALILATNNATRKELRAITDKAKLVEAVERIVATDVEAVLGDVVGEVSSGLGTRLYNLAGINAPTSGSSAIVTSDMGTSGISAGDDVSKYGLWTTPFFNKSVQKSRKGAAGYASSTAGASFGFDTRANDDMIIGAALSFLNSDIKHKNFKSGDKTKVESLMFSIYGMQQITDNWFGQAVATFGSNRVSTSEKRVTGNTTSQTASGKYTSMTFSGEAILGYNYSTGMVAVTPMGGIRATRINDGGYKETGTTNQNLTISKKASNKFELILGARVSGGTFDLGGMMVTPEVHGFVNHDLIGKNPAMDMRLDGSTQSLATKRGKPNKTSYNLGVGLNATYSMMEYGLGYDAHMANKFVGHQGTLKVRVNF